MRLSRNASHSSPVEARRSGAISSATRRRNLRQRRQPDARRSVVAAASPRCDRARPAHGAPAATRAHFAVEASRSDSNGDDHGIDRQQPPARRRRPPRRRRRQMDIAQFGAGRQDSCALNPLCGGARRSRAACAAPARARRVVSSTAQSQRATLEHCRRRCSRALGEQCGQRVRVAASVKSSSTRARRAVQRVSAGRRCASSSASLQQHRRHIAMTGEQRTAAARRPLGTEAVGQQRSCAAGPRQALRALQRLRQRHGRARAPADRRPNRRSARRHAQARRARRRRA